VTALILQKRGEGKTLLPFIHIAKVVILELLQSL